MSALSPRLPHRPRAGNLLLCVLLPGLLLALLGILARPSSVAAQEQPPQQTGDPITSTIAVGSPIGSEAVTQTQSSDGLVRPSLPLTLTIFGQPPLPVHAGENSPRGQEISFHIRGDGSSVVIPLYLDYDTTAGISGLRMQASLFDERGAHLGNVRYSVTVDGADANRGLEIPPGRGQRLVYLTLQDITQIGTLRGFLYTIYQNQILTTQPLVGSRFPIPQVQLVGANGEGVLSIASRSASIRHRLRLQSINRGPVAALAVVVDDFVDAAGNRFPVSHQLTSLGDPPSTPLPALAGLGAAELTIATELPAAGEYTSRLVLVYDDRAEDFTIKVNRTRPQASLLLSGLENPVQSTVPLPWLPSQATSLWFVLHETGGQTLTLSLPELASLNLKGENESRQQAHFGGVRVHDGQGNELRESIILGPNQIERLTLSLQDLVQPGAYEGKLLFTLTDAPPEERTITLLLRQSGWIAGLVILLGVVLSSAAQRTVQSTIPLLERRKRVRELQAELWTRSEALAGLGQEDSRFRLSEMARKLQNQLQILYERGDLGFSDQIPRLLDTVDAKIDLLPGLAVTFEQMEAFAALLRSDELTAQREKLLAHLENDAAGSAEEAQSQWKELVQTLNRLVLEGIAAVMGALRAELAETELAADNANRQQALTAIQTAQEFVDNNRAAAQVDLARAARLLNSAQAAYTRAAAVAAIRSLEALAEPPLGFAPEEWEAERQRMRRGLEAVVAESQDVKVIDLHQQEQTRHLRLLLDKAAAKIVDVSDSESDDLAAIKGDLQKARVLLDTGDWQTAYTVYQAVVEKIEQSIGTEVEETEGLEVAFPTEGDEVSFGKGGGERGMIREVSRTFARFFGLARAPVAELPEAGALDGLLRSSRDLGRQLRRLHRILNLFALIVIVALGLQLLWANNATWGSVTDYLIAILWGLGLQQVGGQSVQSVEGILNSFRQSRPPAGGG